MAKRIETGKPVAPTLNVVFLSYLDDVIRWGTYGNGHTEAMVMLARERIEQLIQSGRLERRNGELVDD